MQKVSFSFPAEFVDQLDGERGKLSRNRFVLRLLQGALREHQEKKLHEITARVYGDDAFAEKEEQLSEDFVNTAPGADL